jgi:peptidoglycan/LPS O-acetylase OafA/YrhL
MPTISIPNQSDPATKQSVYRPELDLLRFIAFFGVFLFHTCYYQVDFFAHHHVPLILAKVLNAAIASGKYGVNLFFVLSSYLITDLLVREREQYGSLNIRLFYLRRILRIWPLYYFVLFVTLSVHSFDPNREFGLKYVLPFLLLSGNWALVAFGGLTSVAASPLWSVSVEEQFYLLWPPLVNRLSRKQIIYAALGMIFIANFARVLILLSSTNAMALWANTFAHLDSIAAGILMAVMLHGRAPSLRPAARIALLMCSAACMTLRGYFQTMTDDSLSWGTTLFGWPIVAISCAITLFAFIGLKMELPWFQYLGKISYGLYAWHMFCIMTVDRLLAMQHRFPEHTFFHAALRESISLGLVIGVSAVSYAVLEKPFLRLKERFTRVRSRPV